MVNGVKSFKFQNECVDFLIHKTTDRESKQVITVKAPAGAGKTGILIQYIDAYLKNTDGRTAFIWFCPGEGNLEEQRKDNMDALTPQRDTRNLMYSMLSGFEPGSVTFINWDLVAGRGDITLKDRERSNLFGKIGQAHKNGVEFVVIIDEEHLNHTKEADDVISAFAAKNMIRISAAASEVSHQEYYEISEEEVTDAGGDEHREIQNDYAYLPDLTDKVYDYFKEAYHLDKDTCINQKNLEAGGYNFSHEIEMDSERLQETYQGAEDSVNSGVRAQVQAKTTGNTYSRDIYLLHSFYEIKKVTGMQTQKAEHILRRMFSRWEKGGYKLIELEEPDFYAFVINNVKKLKADFRNATAQMGDRQMTYILQPGMADSAMPEMEVYTHSEMEKRMLSRLNAYREYTDQFCVDKTHSLSERL